MEWPLEGCLYCPPYKLGCFLPYSVIALNSPQVYETDKFLGCLPVLPKLAVGLYKRCLNSPVHFSAELPGVQYPLEWGIYLLLDCTALCSGRCLRYK